LFSIHHRGRERTLAERRRRWDEEKRLPAAWFAAVEVVRPRGGFGVGLGRAGGLTVVKLVVGLTVELQFAVAAH
jgi:hypothetical protein